MQARLQEERFKQAEADKQEAGELAERIDGMVFTIEVKVDPDGHMYGSVTALDIVHLFEKEEIKLEKRNVPLLHPIKQLGVYPIALKLKEGVPAQITLRVMSEAQIAEEGNA